MNQTTTNRVASQPGGAPAKLSLPVQWRSGATGLPADSAALGDRESLDIEDGLECEIVNENEAADVNRAPGRKLRPPKKNYTSPSDRAQGWLMGDPSQWIGRRLFHRKTGAIYKVRQVFRSGRVELEKNWMTYLSTVTAIRTEYEAVA